MTGYWQANLKDMLEVRGEAAVKEELSLFSCPINPDVEHFIHYTAIEFCKQRISATHLVYTSFKDSPVLVGYYALSNKAVTIRGTNISNNLKRRFNKFSTYDPELKHYYIALPLIGQLGKNYTNGYNKLISGDDLLGFACDKIQEFQVNLGGKMAYLECENNEKLIDFYTRNGFCSFGNRNLDRDEIGHDSIRYLVQMIKYFK